MRQRISYDLLKLSTWLRTNYAKDVLMPVKPGTKHPAFAHKDGSWTWSKYDCAMKDCKSPEVCIILHTLCVIDVDDCTKADELESRFPVLKQVPMETTQHGRHYWFVRSAEADASGYYDGARQREDKVDFKSICRTGTGGIVVVAPSTHRSWVRKPWRVPPIEIPLDLLHAVAVPTTASGEALLRFEDGEVQRVSRKWLPFFSYFEPLNDDLTTKDEEFPVPCRREPLEACLFILNHGYLPWRAPSRADLRAMIVTADKLGIARKVERRLTCSIARFQYDVYTIFPDFFAASHDEREWQRSGASCESILMQLDDAVAERVTYTDIQRDDRWLMWDPQRSSTFKPALQGDQVLRIPKDLEAELPTEVAFLLRRYGGALVLAGGAPLGMVCPFARPGHDYDLFVVEQDADRATAMLFDIKYQLEHRGLIVMRTAHAITIVPGGGSAGQLVIQVVLRLYANAAQVVAGFDMAPSKVAIRFNEARHAFEVVCAPTFLPTMRHLAFPLDAACWGQCTIARAFKYHHKGFGVFIAGQRTSTLRAAAAAFGPIERGDKMADLCALKRIESHLLRRRSPTVPSTQSLSDEEMSEVYKFVRFCSDYGMVAKLQRRLKYIILNALRWGVRWFRKQPLEKKLATEDFEIEWYSCDPGKTCMAMFRPSDAMFHRVYDMGALAALLTSELGVETR